MPLSSETRMESCEGTFAWEAGYAALHPAGEGGRGGPGVEAAALTIHTLPY